jgi:hypothetical protein
MRAQLSQALDAVPVPEELRRSRTPSWRWPASQRFGTAADDAVKSGLQWVDKAHQRQAQRATWWRSAIKANLDQQ